MYYIAIFGLVRSWFHVRVVSSKFELPLVVPTCELPDARKVTDLIGGHASTCFCSVRYLWRKDIKLLDVASWERRTCERFNAGTDAWRFAATTNIDKEARSAQNGVWWTLLSLLLCCNPTRMLSIDVMHNFSGILHDHARELMSPGLGKSIYKAPEYVEARIHNEQRLYSR